MFSVRDQQKLKALKEEAGTDKRLASKLKISTSNLKKLLEHNFKINPNCTVLEARRAISLRKTMRVASFDYNMDVHLDDLVPKNMEKITSRRYHTKISETKFFENFKNIDLRKSLMCMFREYCLEFEYIKEEHGNLFDIDKNISLLTGLIQHLEKDQSGLIEEQKKTIDELNFELKKCKNQCEALFQKLLDCDTSNMNSLQNRIHGLEDDILRIKNQLGLCQ